MTLLAVPFGPPARKAIAGLLVLLLVSANGLEFRDEIRDQQWHMDFLEIDRAHDTSTGAGVVVGLVDSGVDGGHPDLAGGLLPGADLSIRGGQDALEDLDGHGTAMAGLIVANGRALGIAPNATILPVRTAVSGIGVTHSSASAIDWAVDHGAAVLCLAFAGQPNSDLQAAVERAIANDVVVVAGVGNTPDDGMLYPAAYPGVVGAAGVDRNGDHAGISVVSQAAVLAAPAVDVMTTRARTVVPSGYGTGTGTSDATAIIAGVAALVRAKFPELSAQEVIHRMTYTADDRGAPGRDDEYGYGIVNPVAALTADVPPLTQAAPSSTVDGDDGTSTGALVVVGALLAIGVLLLVGLALRRR